MRAIAKAPGPGTAARVESVIGRRVLFDDDEQDGTSGRPTRAARPEITQLPSGNDVLKLRLAVNRPPQTRRRMGRQAQLLRPQQLARQGHTAREIATALGVAGSTAARYVRDPDGHEARARKHALHDVCTDCGRPTRGTASGTPRTLCTTAKAGSSAAGTNPPSPPKSMTGPDATDDRQQPPTGTPPALRGRPINCVGGLMVRLTVTP
jgi:ribosomal protein L34E